MIIKYNNKIIKNGQFLTPKEASVKPIVTYKANPNHLYTLIIHDPDAFAGNHLHWLVINIPGANVNNGLEVLPYKKPHPHPKTGLHPYIFKLFKQTRKINKHVMFRRNMSRKDILDKFDNAIDTPLETFHFFSTFKNNKTVGRKNKNVNKTRKRYNFRQFN